VPVGRSRGQRWDQVAREAWGSGRAGKAEHQVAAVRRRFGKLIRVSELHESGIRRRIRFLDPRGLGVAGGSGRRNVW